MDPNPDRITVITQNSVVLNENPVWPPHTDLQVSAARAVDRVPEVCGVADHGAVDLDPGPVVAQARLLFGLAEWEALADLQKQ